MNCYKAELIAARRSEGVLFLILALAFVAFSLDSVADGVWWLAALDLGFTAFFIACAVSIFRDAHNLKEGK